MSSVLGPAPGFEELDLQGLLEALDGVAWVADRQGTICAVGTRGWTDFANAADAPAPVPQEILGRSVFGFMEGPAVQDHYRELHETVWSGQRRVSMTIRCDAPDIQRRIRLALTPLGPSDHPVGVLYQCQILSEQTRAPIRFLSPQAAVEDLIGDKSPILSVCSFCADVAMSGFMAGDWTTAEAYYRHGGESGVRLSHGICPKCAETAATYMRSSGHVTVDHTAA